MVLLPDPDSPTKAVALPLILLTSIIEYVDK